MNAIINSVNSAVTSREVIHNFAAVAARVAAGEELTVTRYGKPLLKLVQVAKPEISLAQRKAWVDKFLAMRFDKPYDFGPSGKFDRNDAYDE